MIKQQGMHEMLIQQQEGRRNLFCSFLPLQLLELSSGVNSFFVLFLSKICRACSPFLRRASAFWKKMALNVYLLSTYLALGVPKQIQSRRRQRSLALPLGALHRLSAPAFFL